MLFLFDFKLIFMKMKKCSCGTYTFKDICPKCGGRTARPQPPKFSPEDKYGVWRRLAKNEEDTGN